ncbi:MAG: hypothetical protein VR72_10415 [Clostridiaceae bacterium BRH_c20a]|nr:MAG: hypothetical protein VR72_10415 [Clostridiaceae bacterium BRH_c20a]
MFHKVLQVVPTDDYKVYIYFADGKIKLFDASEIIKKGVFRQLQNLDLFKNSCTVLNDTLAWDLTGKFDPSNCLDLDPEELYNSCPEVKEPKVNMNLAT